MKITGPKFTKWFFENNPTVMGEMVNSSNQKITFYEHPTLGDEAPVYGVIDGILFNTDFFDLDDMEAEHGEYTPHLVEGKILMGYEI